MAFHSLVQNRNRNHHRLACVPHAVAVALALFAASAQAQDAGSLKAVTITDRTAAPAADVTGFGDVPLREVPASATVIGSEQIRQSGARRLADLTQFDASVSDAYNAPGYWDFLSIRGFTLDNRFNYRREGLPVNAETAIPLDNKERVEILKGTSGIQAGTSAPGGLVNYIVKRPTQQPLREVRVEVSSRSSVLAAADISQRFGVNNAFGVRINAAHERLRPLVNHLDGERSLLSVAGDWRLSRDSVFEAEIETSHKKQGSQVGFSLWNGQPLPAPVDPNRNLNNQSWVKPTEFDALTGTLRFQQSLDAQWSWLAQVGRQALKTNDYTAFPFGCDLEGVYSTFCSDGTYDIYDFRSANERRMQEAVQLQLRGQLATGTVRHDVTTGVMRSRVRNRFEASAFNYPPVGTGNWEGTTVVPEDPRLLGTNTNRDERSLEFSAQDAIRLNDKLTAWAGLRHTRLDRASIKTDGTEPTSYDQGLTTPWAALSYKLSTSTVVYGSWGQGVESFVVPNKATYTNAGQALPALKSRQVEAGLKGGDAQRGWQLAAFRIARPVTNIDTCASPCDTVAFDGQAVHQGVEANAGWQQGAWRVLGGVTWLHARRQGSSEASINGTRPINVPAFVARLQAGWKVAGLPGLELQGNVSHEGRRNVLADGSTQLPAWTVLGLAAQYDTKMNNVPTTWTLAVDNVLDKRYWRESPTQFGHVYLYPGAARSVRLNFRAFL